MNKYELVEKVASETGLTKRTCREVIESITSTITDALASGEKVTLVGFGSFKVRQRKARRGRNPQTGIEINILAKEVPKFWPGKSLRQAVAYPEPPPMPPKKESD